MNSYSIYGCKIVDKALLINDTLIISDLHFGYESSLNREGLMIPKHQYEEIVDNITDIQMDTQAKNIILNGDIKHNFGAIEKQEWREVLNFIDYLEDLFVNITIIRGNHDNFTQYILDKRDLKLEDYTIIDNYYITHGHKLPDRLPSDIDTIIIGHEHPSITLRSNQRTESVKSYLMGKWENYNIIVLPSFTPISYGSDILSQKTISPYLRDISDFEVIAIDNGEIYPFGSVKNLLSSMEEDIIE
ncbi:MAG: metallophosphoesterase [Methanosphaera sp.]|nr:metallophosphoesterase [Methanosphaera sp.]